MCLLVDEKQAHLIVVHSKVFCFQSAAQLQSGHHVDQRCKDSSHHERITTRCANVRKLFVELFPIMVDPAALYGCVDAIESNYRISCEERVKEETDDPAYK